MPELVLSLFPGIGLLDQGFEDEGFCVVRGPDLLWGGDIRCFHPPRGRFDGVIGGPPCQLFSTLSYLWLGRSVTPRTANLIPEFIQCVEEAAPAWWLMENVERAPCGWLPGYQIDAPLYDNRWIGGEQRRKHRFTFGRREPGPRLTDCLEQTVLLNPKVANRVLASGGDDGHGWPHSQSPAEVIRRDGTRFVRDGKRIRIIALDGHVVDRGRAAYLGRATKAYFQEAKRLQGLPLDFDLPGFKVEEKVRALGNAVPYPMARALARSVKRALGIKEIVERKEEAHAEG